MLVKITDALCDGTCRHQRQSGCHCRQNYRHVREGQHLAMVSEGELLIQVSVIIPRSTEESLVERTLTVKLFAISVTSAKDVSSNFPHSITPTNADANEAWVIATALRGGSEN